MRVLIERICPVAEYISFLLCAVGCMDSFAFDKYMSLCFSWFGASTADYVVVFTPIIALNMVDALFCLVWSYMFSDARFPFCVAY